jgi:hypothetical protein
MDSLSAGYGQQPAFLPATRTLPSWSDVEIAGDNTQEGVKSTLSQLAEFQKAVR